MNKPKRQRVTKYTTRKTHYSQINKIQDVKQKQSLEKSNEH